MSASIYTLLAEELDISDAKAKKLLSAMLREVQKRARRDGVQLPNFGRFKEKEGTLVFEPDDSLAAAVNHRFEGLSAEDLSNAPMEEDEDDSQSEGPNTITLGYQDSSNWSPLDADADAEADDDASDSEDAADTAEFQIPDVDDTADPDDSADDSEVDAPDTAELSPPDSEQASEPSSSSSPPSDTPDSDSADDSSTDAGTDSGSSSVQDTGARETEKLYPLVEDVPGSTDDPSTEEPESSPDVDSSSEEEPSSMAAPDDDRERDTLSGIWDDEDEDDHVTSPSAEPGAPAPEEDPPSGSTSSPSTEFEMPEPSPPEPETEPADESDSTEPDETDSTATEPVPDSESESSLPRILVSILVFLLLGGGAWYILGQRGMVQSPRATVTQLQAALQSGPATEPTQNSTSAVPESSPSEDTASEATDTTSTTTATSDSPPPAAPSSSTSETGTPETDSDDMRADGSETAARDTSAEPSSGETSASASTSSPRTLAPEDGGWSVVVASRTNREAARSLAETYRDRFSGQNLPTGIIEATVNNSTRFRVGVGQFSSRSEVQRFLEKHGGKLPDGAWPVRL